MFFVLSKLLSFLLSPATIILLVMAAALITRRRQVKKVLFTISFILVFLFTNPFLIDVLSRQWEVEDTFDPDKKYDAAILLTGMLFYNEQHDRKDFGSSVDRLTESLGLYRRGIVKRIVISGGSGSLVDSSRREATLLKAFMVNECAVPDSVVLTDTLSRNTYENAVESRKIVQQYGLRELILVTSASHMRRSKALFGKQGVEVATYSVDQTKKQEYYPDDLILPSVKAMEAWHALFHEIAGMIMYKIKGYL